MADLSGKRSPNDPPAPVGSRDFEEFTHENFNDKMAKIKPRVAFQVGNELGGGGNVNVEATFDSIDDFSPDRVAQKVPVLAQLLKDRQQLDNLLAHLDGNDRAEQILTDLLNDPARLQALAQCRTRSGHFRYQRRSINHG